MGSWAGVYATNEILFDIASEQQSVGIAPFFEPRAQTSCRRSLDNKIKIERVFVSGPVLSAMGAMFPIKLNDAEC